MSDADTEYWRALAEQYRRDLEALRARVLAYLESPADHIEALLTAASLKDDVDAIEGGAELKRSDATTALGEVWDRVAADEQ